MINDLLSVIAERYPLADADSIMGLKASGMKFNIKSYKAEGLGHVSVMSA